MTGLKTRISPINSIYTLERELKIQFYSPTTKYYATSRGLPITTQGINLKV